MTVSPVTIAADVRHIGLAGVERIVADVFLPTPDHLDDPPAVVVCLPGGGMSRYYFDLCTPDGGDRYSMARHLAAAGLVIVTIDPPGVGESDRPADGYALTPHLVADVATCAARVILDRLGSGTLDDRFPPLPAPRRIGLGHSAGALLTVVQQARDHRYDALVLLGFHGRGLIDVLTDDERRYVDDPAALRPALASLAEARFGDPLPLGTSSSSSRLIHGEPPPAAMAAIRRAASPLLALVGVTSLVPGSVRDELREIDVPVFLGVGEHDITGPARGLPNELPGSRDITVFVLPGAGHNHNVADDRAVLWNRIAQWITTMGRAS